jgi:zinc transport system ATP-binding protein
MVGQTPPDQEGSRHLMDAVVELSRVDFAYRDRLVLTHIDLSLMPGSTLGLIGPNGGGKTTLIRLLAGLTQPTRGEIRVAGMSPRDAAAGGNVLGYLPQLPRLETRLPLTLRQAVRLGLAGKTGMLRRASEEDLAFVEHLLSAVGLAADADEPIGRLSGGQLQRMLIARALAPRPRLLLLDEPTTGIDAPAQDRFIALIRELKTRFDLTIVLASHDLRAVGELCDHVACLNLSMHVHDPQHPITPDEAHALICNFGASRPGT